MRLLIDDDSTCSKDRACAQQPDKTREMNAGGISPGFIIGSRIRGRRITAIWKQLWRFNNVVVGRGDSFVVALPFLMVTL